MKLKKIEWQPVGRGKRFECRGIAIDIVPSSNRKNCKWHWFLTAGDSGGVYGDFCTTYDKSGVQPTEAEAIASAEAELLSYLLYFFEDQP